MTKRPLKLAAIMIFQEKHFVKISKLGRTAPPQE